MPILNNIYNLNPEKRYCDNTYAKILKLYRIIDGQIRKYNYNKNENLDREFIKTLHMNIKLYLNHLRTMIENNCDDRGNYPLVVHRKILKYEELYTELNDIMLQLEKSTKKLITKKRTTKKK